MMTFMFSPSNVVGFDLEAKRGPNIHLQPFVDRLLGLAHGQGRIGYDELGCPERRRHQLGGAAHVIEDAPRQRLGRAERVPREYEFVGATLAHDAWQRRGAAHPWNDADLHFGKTEPGALHAIGEVSRKDHFQPAAIRIAVDGRDDRYGAFHHRPEGLLGNFVLMAPGLVGHALALFHVAPGAEGALAGPGHDDTAHAAGLAHQACPQIEQVDAHLRAQGVSLVGPVERDDQQSAVARFDQQR
jgi:hypothetical protein